MSFNHNQKIFIICKSIILVFSDFECFVCGLVSSSNHVHHIDKNSANNDLFNLVCLCSNCNINAHKNNYILKPKYTTSTILLFNQFNLILTKIFKQ